MWSALLHNSKIDSWSNSSCQSLITGTPSRRRYHCLKYTNLVFWTARHPGHFQQNFPLDIVMARLHYQNCLILKVTTKLLLSNCQIHTWYLSSASIAWVILHYVYKEGGGGACRYHAMWSEILNCYPNFSNFLAQVTWIKFASLNRLRINYFVNFYVHEFGGTVNVLFSQLCRMFHVM